MWRPRALGTVIAERTLRLDRPGRRSTVVRVEFGRPARLQWLEERESLVFANTFASGLLARNLQNCIMGLADAADVLENAGTRAAERTLARRLRALVASGGHTADPRRVRPSDTPLGRPGFAGSLP